MSPNPYAPPAAQVALPQVDPRDVRRRALASMAWLGGSVAVLVAGLFCAASGSRPVGVVGGLGAAACAMVGVARGVSAVAMARRATTAGARVSRGFLALGAFAAFVNFAMIGAGALGAWVSTWTFSRGRQLRRFGRVLLPPLARGASWARGGERIEVDEEAREPLAARWRENGRTEHASVAAFARVTLDLLALGAPPRLVAAAQRDALDEIAHAEACFALARAIDGADVGPGPFPEAARARTLPRVRLLALAQLAVDSLVDGALHEGVSARVVAKLARRCEVRAIRDTLTVIAADEGRHARHGWDVALWCVAEGGAPVVSALRGAVSALPATMSTPLPQAAAGGAWERWGIHGHALEAEEYAAARAHLARSVARLSGGDPVRRVAEAEVAG